MAEDTVVNNKVLIPRDEVVTDLKNQRWIVGASLGVDGSRDIYAVARCDNNKTENYPAVMIFKPHGSDSQTAEMQAHVCNPKTIEKWKKSRGVRHLAVTPILGVGSYKYNDKIYPYIITQRYAKNLQQLLASNNEGFILPTIYRVIGQMFYAVEYIHSLGYYIKFDITSDKLLHSFTNPNDIYLDIINYEKTQECLTYRSGKFPVESPYGNLESILYNAFNWLKLPLPWKTDLTDENLVNKKKIKAFAHVDTFLRCVFGKFRVLNPIRNIMLELASSDITKEPDYKKFLSIVAEGARNLTNVQYNLDSSLNFDEQLKLRQINKLSRRFIPSFSEDFSDENESKVFKKMLNTKGENSTKATVPIAENNTSNAVTTSLDATTSTTSVEPAKISEPSKTPVNEVTQDGKPKESESQNEQQRTIPRIVSQVEANTSSNVQPEKDVTTLDSIGCCKCKTGVVSVKNTILSPKIEIIDVSSGDEVSRMGKPQLKVEKPEKKDKKDSSEKNKDAEKIKRRKTRNISTSSENSDSGSKENILKKKKKKRLLKKKKKEGNSKDSGSDSDDSSSDSTVHGKSKNKKKKRRKHRNASLDSGDTSNPEIEKVKRKKSKIIKTSESDESPTSVSNKKEYKSTRRSTRRQDRDSDLNSLRHFSRRDYRSKISHKRRKDSDHNLSPRRSGENKNEFSSRNRKRSPSKYEQRFSRPRDNSYSTKSRNNSDFSDSRYQSNSGSFRQKMFHNFKNSSQDQSNFSYGQTSNIINSHRKHYIRGNKYAKFRSPFVRGGSSQRRDHRIFLNHHERQSGQQWNFLPRSDGRSTSPASTTSSNLIEQKQAHNVKYSHEEAQLRNAYEKENASGQILPARDRRRDFKLNTAADDRYRHNERYRIEKLNRVESRDDLLKKGLPPIVNKPATRDTDDDFLCELRTVEQEESTY